MTRMRKIITLALISGLLFAMSGTAFAQGRPTYPPQPPTPPVSPGPPSPRPSGPPSPRPGPPSPRPTPPSSPPGQQNQSTAAQCVDINIAGAEEVDGVAQVDVLSGFGLEGAGGSQDGGPCAEQGSNVVVFGQSHRIDFDDFAIANEDGSFTWPQQDGNYTGPRVGSLAQLPAHWQVCERHTINVEVEGLDGIATQPVQILGPDGTMASCGTEVLGDTVVRDDGTQVLGDTGLRDDGTQVLGGGVANEDGLLPLTGFNLLLLVLWAIGLIGVGTMLVTAVWRRMQGRPVPLPAIFRNTPPALPPAEVPRLDTTDFVMARVHHREAPADRHQSRSERPEPPAERPPPSPDIRDRVRRRLESDADVPLSPAELARPPRVSEEPRATRPSTPAVDEEFTFSADDTTRR